MTHRHDHPVLDLLSLQVYYTIYTNYYVVREKAPFNNSSCEKSPKTLLIDGYQASEKIGEFSVTPKRKFTLALLKT